ncbi:MAG TPA: nitroreductase/quinone reductase family protein, partial [Methylomirabilota bacterium]|nr:nitroreductase/quinone reductase family protein [Methylomirabilota bacterium]
MAATYRLGLARRVVNALVRALLRLDLFLPPTYHLLTVTGRKTGRQYSTPVTLIEEGGERWLVAPYGEVGWVRNARAGGRVTLSRGSRSESLRLEELGAAAAAPVLKRYVT